MTTLEGLFIGGIVCTILALLAAIYFFLRFLLKGKKIKRLPVKRLKNKKRQRQLVRARTVLTKEKKQAGRRLLLSILASVIFAGTTVFISYYQSMNLSDDDANAVVKSYYLLRDFEEQLEKARDGSDEEAKVQTNLRYLATTMASYSNRRASYLNTEEGQLTLNRYYNAVSRLGVNASVQTTKFYNNQELVAEYLQDLEKAKVYEKAAFEYYKVDEARLENEQ